MNTFINDFPDGICNLLIKERPLFMAKLLSHPIAVFVGGAVASWLVRSTPE